MSLRFLLTKSWHTANLANQRKVFEAELEQDFLKKREAERQKVFEQERAFEETRKLMIEQGKGGKEIDLLKGKGGALSFMYEPPPGYAQHENSVENPAVLQAHQERLAAKGLPVNAIGNNDDAESRPNIDPETMKPLGLDIRNVRCVKCKQWGHQMGDSACPMKAVSVETERFRQQIEDPLMVFDRSRGAAVTDRLVLRQTLDGIHGGEGADSANQQILLSDDEDSGLPRSKEERKAMRRRMKELRKKLKAEKKKKHKKHKKSKKASSSSSSSSSNSSDSEPSKTLARIPEQRQAAPPAAGDRSSRDRPAASEEPHTVGGSWARHPAGDRGDSEQTRDRSRDRRPQRDRRSGERGTQQRGGEEARRDRGQREDSTRGYRERSRSAPRGGGYRGSDRDGRAAREDRGR